MYHSVPVSLLALLIPLQQSIHYSNATLTDSQKDISMFPDNAILCPKGFKHPNHLRTCLYPHPPKSMPEILINLT
jgi:hypothetical protein